MSNMSYCRFHNTALDLDDCQSALSELIENDTEPLSDDETRSARRLIAHCITIVEMIADASGVSVEELMEMGSNAQREKISKTLDDLNAAAKQRADQLCDDDE